MYRGIGQQRHSVGDRRQWIGLGVRRDPTELEFPNHIVSDAFFIAAFAAACSWQRPNGLVAVHGAKMERRGTCLLIEMATRGDCVSILQQASPSLLLLHRKVLQ